MRGRHLDQITTIFVKFCQLFALLLLVFPLIIVGLTSIDPNGLTGNLMLNGVTLQWYQNFLAFGPFLTVLNISIALGAIATCATLLIAIPTSYMLARKEFKGKETVNTLFISPIVIPGVVIGSALLFYLYSLGLRNSFTNLVIAHTLITLPYALRVLTSSFVGLDIALEEAAMNLGATELQTFFRVTLPALKTGLLASAIFAFAVSFQNVDVSIFLTAGTVNTFPVIVLSYLRGNYDPTVAAASMIILVSTAALVIALDRIVGLKRIAF